MMMYEELVEQLREHRCDATEDDTQEFCEECSYNVIIADKNKQNGVKAVCVCGLMNRAAAAIEELSISVKNGETAYEIMVRQTSYIEELQKKIPRWIPVTDKEHIPNTDHGVVGYFGGGAFNQLRWYDFVTTLSDGKIVGESTERDVINEHCIAVYKLPEPPKEG